MNNQNNIPDTNFRILIGVNHLKTLGGSEIYTYTLASHLLKLGYTVDILTYYEGIVSKKLEVLSSKCTIVKRKDLLEKSYDLAIISHNSLFILPIDAKYKIQVCHGVYPSLEQPTFLADYHIAISNEVSDHLRNLGFENEVVFNPIDLERFYPMKPINNKVQNVLSLCQGESANKLLEAFCKEENLNLVCYNKFEDSIWDIENAINDADLVVSIGRGVIESMACGRPVLIYDHRSYSNNYSDGMLTSKNIDEVKKYNFSGRKFKHYPTKEFLKEEIAKYNVELGNYNLEYAKKHFNVKKVIKDIFDINNEEKISVPSRELYRKMFSYYENKIVFNEENNPYFIKHNQKCPLEDITDLSRFLERYELDSINILRGEESHLNLIPTTTFGLMSKLHRNSNYIKHHRKLLQREKDNKNQSEGQRG